MLIKQMHQKNVVFVTSSILKILVLSMSHIFAIIAMIQRKKLLVLMMLLLLKEVLTKFNLGRGPKVMQLP